MPPLGKYGHPHRCTSVARTRAEHRLSPAAFIHHNTNTLLSKFLLDMQSPTFGATIEKSHQPAILWSPAARVYERLGQLRLY